MARPEGGEYYAAAVHDDAALFDEVGDGAKFSLAHQRLAWSERMRFEQRVQRGEHILGDALEEFILPPGNGRRGDRRGGVRHQRRREETVGGRCRVTQARVYYKHTEFNLLSC